MTKEQRQQPPPPQTNQVINVQQQQQPPPLYEIVISTDANQMYEMSSPVQRILSEKERRCIYSRGPNQRCKATAEQGSPCCDHHTCGAADCIASKPSRQGLCDKCSNAGKGFAEYSDLAVGGAGHLTYGGSCGAVHEHPPSATKPVYEETSSSQRQLYDDANAFRGSIYEEVIDNEHAYEMPNPMQKQLYDDANAFRASFFDETDMDL
jgi:hypothetical protein